MKRLSVMALAGMAAGVVLCTPVLAQSGGSNSDKDKDKDKNQNTVRAVPGTGAFAGRMVNPQTGLPIDNPPAGPGGVLAPPIVFQGTRQLGNAPYNYTGLNNPATPEKAVEYWRRRIVPGLGGNCNGGAMLIVVNPGYYYAAPWYYGGYPGYGSYNSQGFSLGGSIGGLGFGFNSNSGSYNNQVYQGVPGQVGSGGFYQSGSYQQTTLGGAPLASSVLRSGGSVGGSRVENYRAPQNYVIDINGDVTAGTRSNQPRQTRRPAGDGSGYYLDQATKEPSILDRDADLRSAISDIERAFVRGEIALLEKHVQPGGSIMVRSADGSTKGITGNSYLALTREALKVMQTASYKLQTLEPAAVDGDLLVKGRHELKGEGGSAAYHVEFTLTKRAQRWVITGAGAQPAR